MQFKEKEVLELLEQLVAIKSPYFEEEDVMHYVESWFIKNNIPAQVHEYHESKVTGFKGKNIVVDLSGSKNGPTLALNGHLDTVHLCRGWTRNPEGEKVGDKYYGVGALDMKSGCVATMLALKAFTENYKDFSGRIISTYVSVEEGPYGMGTNALIEDGYLDHVDFSLITEPTAGFTGNPFPDLSLGARGGYGLEIEFHGFAAHAANPEKGVSAIVEASKFIGEIEKTEMRKHEKLGAGTACVVAFESDGGACSVPDYAKIKLFWHIVIGENMDTIKAKIEEIAEKAGIQCRYTVKFREAPSKDSTGFLPFTVDENNPYVQAFMDTVHAVCGKKPSISYFQSIGDFNYLGTRLGAPAIIFGADGQNYHSKDEYVFISSVIETTQIVYDFLVHTLIE